MFSGTHFICMLFVTNFSFILFALMLFGNSPDYPTNMEQTGVHWYSRYDFINEKLKQK